MSREGTGLDAQTKSSQAQSSQSPTTSPSTDPAKLARHISSARGGGISTPQDVAVSALRTPSSQLAVYCAKMPDASINSFCGAMGGIASGIVTCPLDVIKTRLQAQGSFRRNPHPKTTTLYHGMVGTARTIWKEDGISGMYRGLGPMLLGYLPTWAVYMTVYDMSREYYRERTENVWLARIYASITAGACSTVTTNPIWVLKTRIMAQVSANAPPEAQTPWRYKSTVDAARSMFRDEGIRVFYSGLAPALLGLSHVAIQFPLYEYFKERFTGLAMGENTTESDNENHWFGILAATFLSKICATSATYPHEVLRTRLQTQQRTSGPHHMHDEISFRGRLGGSHVPRMPGGSSSDGMINLPRYKGMMQTIATIVREEGWRAFYSGLGTNMVRAVPAAMTTMLTYETMKTSIHKLQAEGRRMAIEEGL